MNSSNMKKWAITSYNINTGILGRTVYLTPWSVYIPRWLLGDINIPYTAMTECNYSQKSDQDCCSMEYKNRNNQYNRLQLHSCFEDTLGALKTYYSILQISQQQGYWIGTRIDEKVTKFQERLKTIGVTSEFIESDDLYLALPTSGTTSEQHWRRELGSLRLYDSDVNLIKVTESGYAAIEVTHTTHYSSNGSSYTTTTRKLVFYPQYNVDFVVETANIQMKAHGVPVKKFAGLLMWGYEWQGTHSAERLNHDLKLIEMLKKAKAPAIRIRGNHIQLSESTLPSQTLFQCIDRIAAHIRGFVPVDW